MVSSSPLLPSLQYFFFSKCSPLLSFLLIPFFLSSHFLPSFFLSFPNLSSPFLSLSPLLLSFSLSLSLPPLSPLFPPLLLLLSFLWLPSPPSPSVFGVPTDTHDICMILITLH